MRVQNKPFDALSASLAGLIPKCPACKGELAGHSYAQFASTVLSTENLSNVKEFEAAFQAGQWRKLATFQKFDMMLDNLVAYVHRCPDGAVTALLTHDPFEMYFSVRMVSARVLTGASAEEIFYLSQPSAWHPYLLTPAP